MEPTLRKMLFESEAGAETDQPIIPNHYHQMLSNLFIRFTNRTVVTYNRSISSGNQLIVFLTSIVTRIPAPASLRIGFTSFQ